MTQETDDKGYIIEYAALGNSVKVTAVDPETMVEAVIVGAPSVSRQELAELAVRKLHYVMAKQKDAHE